jgi:small GTP-binding protein
MGCGSSSPSNVGSSLLTKSTSSPLTILVIGLDNSGKTTLSHTINGDLDPIIVPTVGFNAPTRRRVKGQAVTFFDLGGGSRIRGVWPQYFADVHGIVFVVDSADSNRFEEAKNELHSALVHPMIVGKPLLVLANKEDLPNAKPAKVLGEDLELEKAAVLCRHSIIGCSAKPVTGSSSSLSIETSTAQGLPVLDSRIGLGLEWLVDAIRNDWDKLEERRKREQLEHKKQEDFARKERLRKIQEETAAATAATTVAAASSTSTSNQDKKNETSSTTSSSSSSSSQGPSCKICKSAPAVRRCAAAGWEAVCDPCGNKAEAVKIEGEAVKETTVDEISNTSSSEIQPVSPTPFSPTSTVTIIPEETTLDPEVITSHKTSTPLKSSLSSHDLTGSPIHKHAHFDILAETPLPNQCDNPISPTNADVIVISSTTKQIHEDTGTNGNESNLATPLKSPIRGIALSPVFDEAASTTNNNVSVSDALISSPIVDKVEVDNVDNVSAAISSPIVDNVTIPSTIESSSVPTGDEQQ